jgi:hypothetical protein
VHTHSSRRIDRKAARPNGSLSQRVASQAQTPTPACSSISDYAVEEVCADGFVNCIVSITDTIRVENGGTTMTTMSPQAICNFL